jgi:hypothetical protein
VALWQVEFQVIPRRALAATTLTSSVLANTDWWVGHRFPPDYRARLAVVVVTAPYSTGGQETWGTEDGNRVDVWSEEGHVRRVTTRVDVRRLDSRFGAALLDFVRKADAVLVRSDGLVVEPLVGAYAGALRNSKAWGFASDSAAFFAANDEDE